MVPATDCLCRQQACEIDRVEERMPMAQFLKEYRDKPLIFAAKARVGTLPFEITRELHTLDLCQRRNSIVYNTTS